MITVKELHEFNESNASDKWNTPENRQAYEALEKEYGSMTCAFSCPLAWAPDVLKLLREIDAEFGIKKNDSAYQDGWLYIYSPWKLAKNLLKLFKKKPDFCWSKDMPEFDYRAKVIIDFFYLLKRTLVNLPKMIKAKIYNYWYRPKVSIDQVKEKFGSLRVYYECDAVYTPIISHKIGLTEKTLEEKGLYLKG